MSLFVSLENESSIVGDNNPANWSDIDSIFGNEELSRHAMISSVVDSEVTFLDEVLRWWL